MCKKRILAFTACLIGLALPVSESAAATFLYDVDISRPVTFPGFVGPTPDFVQGTITTDCNNCVMLQSDIVDWNLTIAVHGMPSASLLGPLSGNNSILSSYSGTNDLVATSVGLFFNFATPGAVLAFGGGIDGANGIYVVFYNPANSSNPNQGGIQWSIDPTRVIIDPTSDQIGTAVSRMGDGDDDDRGLTAAVPEPSTWAMMLLGFAGLGFALRKSRRKVSFA